MRFTEKLKKRLLCFFIASSLILTGCSGGNPTDEGEDEVEKEQYEIVVMNQYGEVVSGAQVSIAGGTYTTSNYGTIKMQKPTEGEYPISVVCNNYHNYDSTYNIGSESVGKVTIKAAILAAHRLQSAVYKRGAGSVDLVDTYKKVNKGTAGWEFSIKASVCGDAGSVTAYKLFQRTETGDKEIASSSNGEFNNLSINDFEIGTGVFITVYDNAGNKISTSLRFEIAKDPNYTEYTELSFGNETKIQISDDVPLFGGTELNFGFPSIPLDYKMSGDTIHIGFNVDDETFDDDAQLENYKKMLNQVKAAKFQSTNMKTAIAQLKKKQKKKGVMGMAGFDKNGVEVSCSGYAEAGVNSDGSLSSGTGYLCITAEASAEFDWQFVVWIIPVTIGIEGKIEADFAGTITYDFNANKLEGESSLTIKPSLTANAGIGFKYLNGGVYGSAGLETKLIIASLSEEPGFSYLDLNSSIGIYADIAWFEPKHDIAKGTFHLWTRENKLSASSLNNNSDGMLTFSELYDLKNYKPSEKSDKIKIKAVSQDDKTVLVSGVNPGSAPVAISNGKEAINVYSVREAVEGTDYTSPKLYYQIYKTDDEGVGSWSEAKSIDENQSDASVVCSEMNHKLYTDGKDFYMVYQDSSIETETLKKYSTDITDEEKDSIFEKMWEDIDLHVKKYDTEKDIWIDYGKINTEGAFDYNGDIVVHNNKIYVCNAANTQGDYFGTGTNENYINISSCELNDSAEVKEWTVKKAAEGLNSVTSLAVGVKNNKVSCVYVVDADNELSTGEQDVFAYKDNVDEEAVKVCTGDAVTVGCSYANEKLFTISSNDTFSCLEEDNTVKNIVENAGSYDGIYSITEKGIYFVKNTETGTEIYAKYKAPDGTYGDLVQITEENRWLRNLSAFTINGKDYLVTSSDYYDTEGDGKITDSEIDVFEVEDYYDLNVKEASYDLNDSLTGQQLPVTLKLKNEGNKKISFVKVDVKDADGDEVVQKNKYYTVDMNPGCEKDIVLDLSGIDIAEYGDWEISTSIVASVPKEQATPEVEFFSPSPEENQEETPVPVVMEPEVLEEKTLDNNNTQMSIGNSDFVVRTQMCDSGAYPYMLVEVRNEGNRSDSATLNLYNANDVTEKYNNKNISNLAPGSAKMFKVNINSDWADDNGKVAVLAHIQDASNEMYTYNNYAYQYSTINYGRFLIRYILDGGTNNSANPDTYTTSDTIVLKDPSRNGYTFEGWYTSSTFNIISKITEISSGNAQDIDVYAKWKQKAVKDDDSDKKPSATPTPVPTSKTTPKPTVSPKPESTPGKENDDSEKGNNQEESTTNKVKLLKKGTVKKLTKYYAVVKVTKSGKIVKNKITGGEVQYIKPLKNKTSISIPDTVKIGKFSYKVKSIAANALKNKKTLKKVIVGKNIVSIGKNTFAGCKKLKNITIKSTGIKSVGRNVFKGINTKAVVKVPKTKYKKYKKLFNKKTGFGKKMKLKK